MPIRMRDTSSSRNISSSHDHVQAMWSWLMFVSGRQDAMADVAWSCFVVGTFYTLGCLMNSSGTHTSVVLLAVIALVSNAQGVFHALASILPASVYVYVVATTSLQIAVASIFIASRRRPARSSAKSDASLFKPMIFPCRTTHSRFFPTKHSFSYTYLLVGIPVHWEGTAGTLLSAGDGTDTWFTVNAQDYLARGKHGGGLRGKLRDYLAAQGISPDRYAHAYLITAPRFLGFSFNPVSFWYLYNRDSRLTAMILEVNNTFDERRMYYMECEDEQSVTSAKAFRTSWPKDFHVSPFNDRDGAYSLTAKDIMSKLSEWRLDNNIVLLSGDGKPKITARVYSTEDGLDPNDMPGMKTWSFLARWWWVGFMTNPRILREARLLWVKGLQVFYRPEVFRSSIGRNETLEETLIEPHFRSFLQDLVNAQEKLTTISYLVAAGPDRGKVIDIRNFRDESTASSARKIEVHVLTPALYSEVVKFGSIDHAFSKVCFEPGKGAAMMYSSDHGQLRTIVQEAESKRNHAVHSSRRQVFVSCLRSRGILGTFRNLPNIVRENNHQKTHPSGLDCSVRDGKPPLAYKVYLQTVVRVLLIDRLALGFAWIFDLYGQSVRLATLWWIYRDVVVSALQTNSTSTLLRLAMYAGIYHTVNKLLAA